MSTIREIINYYNENYQSDSIQFLEDIGENTDNVKKEDCIAIQSVNRNSGDRLWICDYYPSIDAMYGYTGGVYDVVTFYVDTHGDEITAEPTESDERPLRFQINAILEATSRLLVLEIGKLQNCSANINNVSFKGGN